MSERVIRVDAGLFAMSEVLLSITQYKEGEVPYA